MTYLAYTVYFKPHRSGATWTTKHAESTQAVFEGFAWDNPTADILAVHPQNDDPGNDDKNAYALELQANIEKIVLSNIC